MHHLLAGLFNTNIIQTYRIRILCERSVIFKYLFEHGLPHSNIYLNLPNLALVFLKHIELNQRLSPHFVILQSGISYLYISMIFIIIQIFNSIPNHAL